MILENAKLGVWAYNTFASDFCSKFCSVTFVSSIRGVAIICLLFALRTCIQWFAGRAVEPEPKQFWMVGEGAESF